MSENLPTGRNLPAREPADPLATIWGPLVLALAAACMTGLVLTVHYFPGIWASLTR